jgi:hypothetical protein
VLFRSLNVKGGQYAISAEGKTDFTMSVLDGAYASCWNTQNSGIYTAGQATYNVDGPNSRLELLRTGVPEDSAGKDSSSLYGVIYHDASSAGPLTINVTNGGFMSASNSFGSRAAITCQSNMHADNSINVIGAGSTLKIVNSNSGGGPSRDAAMHPVGAVAFTANCGGCINVRNGGNLYAESNSADSPVIALGNNGPSDLAGALTLDRPGEVDIRNGANAASARAVAVRGRDAARAGGGPPMVFEARQSDITAWNPGGGPAGWPDAAIAGEWKNAGFAAANGAGANDAAGDRGKAPQFALSKYGRIYARGSA